MGTQLEKKIKQNYLILTGNCLFTVGIDDLGSEAQLVMFLLWQKFIMHAEKEVIYFVNISL